MKRDWADAYKKENIEVRHIKTKEDLNREVEFLKTKKKLTHCISYKVEPNLYKEFFDVWKKWG